MRQNKLGLTEAEFQQTLAQQPTITAIEKLGEQIQIQQQPTVTIPSVSAIEKLAEKLTEKKQENDAASENVNEIAEIDEEGEMGRIASFLEQMAKNRTTSKRFKSGILTVDSDNRLGDLPMELDFDRKVVKVGDRESRLSLPLLELLYAPTSAVFGRAYDRETIKDFERLTELEGLNGPKVGATSICMCDYNF